MLISKIDLVNLGFAKNVQTGAKSPALETLIFFLEQSSRINGTTALSSKNEAENSRIVYRDFSGWKSPVITNFSALEFWTFPLQIVN